MHRLLLLILSITTLSFTAWAQDSEDPAAGDVEQAEIAADPDADTAVDADEPEPVVDDEFYQDVDDQDFRPSEEIPADQSIPFPSDI